jgi:hypothetical protein
MTICDYCHKESKLIFTCLYCGSHYCKDHRKPVDHECISIREEKFDKIVEEKTDIDDLTPIIIQEPSDFFNAIESEVKAESGFSYFQENLEIDQEITYPLDDEKDTDFTDFEQEIEMEDVFEEEEIDEEDDEEYVEPSSSRSPLSSMIRKEAFLVIMLLFGIILGQMMTTVINPSEYDQNLQQRYDRIYEYYIETQALNVELNVLIDELTSDLVTIESQLNQITIEYNQLLDDYHSLQSE